MARTPHAARPTDLLRAYDHKALIQMAEAHGIDDAGKSRDALVKLVGKRLADPNAIATALEGLKQLERTLLDHLILAGGEAMISVIRAQLLAEGWIERSDRGGTQNVGLAPVRVGKPSKLAESITRLGTLGLVFNWSAGQRNVHSLGTLGQYLFIPQAILQHLPPVDLPIERIDPPPRVETATPDAFQRDLYHLLSAAQKQPIPLTVKGLIPKRTLVQIDESLRVPEGASKVKSEAELGRLPLLRAVAEQLGLVTAGAQGLQLGDAAPAFLTLTRGERERKVYEAYRETQGWSELSRLKDILVSPKDRLRAPGIVAARKRVLEEIAVLPAGEWIRVDHFVDRMRKRAFEFLLPRDWYARNYAYYGYVPDPYEGYNALGLSFVPAPGGADEATWETVEAAVIRVVITEALHWLGLVDLGWTPDDAARAFRVTGAGAAILAGGTPATVVQNPHVVIQPNFQIFAFEPTGEDVLFALDRIAERVRSEQVVEYHLTRESIYAAQRHGMEMADILGFLQQISSVPMPQNVQRTLEEWGAQMERIVVRRHVSLLHAIDEGTLDTLYADPELRGLLGRRLTPTAALVPTKDLNAVASRVLSGEGIGGPILPALSEGDDAMRARTITVDAAGRIAFQQPLPSIYVRAALRPFAEEDEGAMRLTPGSLQRAANTPDGRGQTHSADAILDRLAQMSVTSLPDEVTSLVRRWARAWGRGALAEVVLLRVENEATMKDLQADDEIGPYLQSIPGAPTLAAVHPEHAEMVRGVLLERGMDLDDRILSPSKR